MKRAVTALVSLALASSAMLFTNEVARSESPPDFEDGVVVVGFTSGTTWATQTLIGAELGAVARVEYEGLGATLFDVAPGTVLEKVREFSRRPEVLFAEPNYIARAVLAPNDALWSSQYGPQKVQAPQGWDLYPGTFAGQGTSATGVKTAVVDTGILASHSDLNDGRVLTSLGANCVSGVCSASSATDDNGHGTHVAGIMAAETNNLEGMAGIAFNSTMIPVKVLDSSGAGNYTGAGNGIVWAAQKGAKVINLSLGGTSPSTALCNSVSIAINTYGAVVVAASGNDGVEGVFYPAACAGVVAVGASSSSDARASFSNFGPQLWNVAPGVDITSTYRSSYDLLSGTSMASPHAAAVAAMISSQSGGSISVSDVRKRLASTADKVGTLVYGSDPNGLACLPACTWNKYYGYGRVNLYKAMQSAQPNFALSASPSSQSVAGGASANYAVTVARSGGFASDVTLSVSGLPTGASGSFSPNPVSSGNGSTLTVATAPTTPVGTYPLTVTGVGDTLSRTTTVTLVVAGPDFSLSASPSSRTIASGAGASYAVAINRVGGFTSDVTLSVSGLPTGASGSFNPNPVSGSASTFSITSTSSVATGTYALTITGSSGALVKTTTATLIISNSRKVRHGYVGVTGDVLNLSCAGLGVNLGGACIPVLARETSVAFTIDDDTGWRVGGFWRFLNSANVTLTSGYFCASSSQLIPSGAAKLQVFVEEGLSTLDCGGAIGAGTTGGVDATFT